MIKEKVILSILAVIGGLTVAVLGFYFYQNAKSIPEENIKKITVSSPTPSPTPSIFLEITEPKDESVSTKKIVTISGKTVVDATVTIVTASDEDVVTPSSLGEFTTTLTLDNDENHIRIISIAPNGETISKDLTVTFSTEEF